MTSRRMLKKKIHHVVNNIVEECYSLQLENKAKQPQTNKIIDETVSAFDDLLTRMHNVNEIQDRNEMRKFYESINADLEKMSLAMMKKLNSV